MTVWKLLSMASLGFKWSVLKNIWSFSLVMLAALASSVAAAQSVSGAAMQPVECNSIYMVKRGDSLSKIANRVYGRTSAFQPIFDYNPGVIKDPNRVPTGVGLYIPCIDDTELTELTAEELPELTQDNTNVGLLKVLTGSDYPPYTDEDLPNGGFSVELVERALLHDDGPSDYRVDFINDWSSHLRPLLSDGAYHLALPWFKPDCSARDKLSESSIWRCDNLLFSEPLHDVVVSFHTTTDKADRITSTQDMQGLKICRPSGYFTHDLEAMGLVEGSYERLAPTTPTDCFELLEAGNADIVTVNADTTDQILTELDIREQTRELIDFANIQTLHIVAMKTDPRARVNLLRVNKGLIALKRSGDFREIAKTHLR